MVKDIQEPKYKIQNGSIANRTTGKQIPEDEPVMIFRAQDRKAMVALEGYAAVCENEAHRKSVERRIADFQKYQKEHPDRMKEPDTE